MPRLAKLLAMECTTGPIVKGENSTVLAFEDKVQAKSSKIRMPTIHGQEHRLKA
jgi:hypothetical protein